MTENQFTPFDPARQWNGRDVGFLMGLSPAERQAVVNDMPPALLERLHAAMDEHASFFAEIEGQLRERLVGEDDGSDEHALAEAEFDAAMGEVKRTED